MSRLPLEKYPTWRYCRVRAGEKVPYPQGWQKNPLTLDQVDSTNIGLMLGHNGVCSLDFDGPSSWRWFDQELACSLPRTAIWTSGREGRCQMAFSVPQQYWTWLKTVKISAARSDTIAAGEGFEFRWLGAQSVIPPSIHPTTQQPYQWLDTSPLAELPDPVLARWLELSNPVRHRPVIDLQILTQRQVDDAERLLQKCRERHSSLDYDTWLAVSWAVAHHLGTGAAEILMSKYYPEQKPGEYRRLYSGYDRSRSPTLGTLHRLAWPQTQPKLEDPWRPYGPTRF